MKFIICFQEVESTCFELFDVIDYIDLVNQICESFSEKVEIKEMFYYDYQGDKISIEENDDVIAMKEYHQEKDLNIITIHVVIDNFEQMKQYLNKSSLSPLSPIENEVNSIIQDNNKKLKDDIMNLINAKFFSHKKFVTCYKCSNCRKQIYGKVYHCQIHDDYLLCEKCIDDNFEKKFHVCNFIVKLKEI